MSNTSRPKIYWADIETMELLSVGNKRHGNIRLMDADEVLPIFEVLERLW